MDEILHRLAWYVWNLVNNGINYLSTGAGFCPSTVSVQTILTTKKTKPSNILDVVINHGKISNIKSSHIGLTPAGKGGLENGAVRFIQGKLQLFNQPRSDFPQIKGDFHFHFQKSYILRAKNRSLFSVAIKLPIDSCRLNVWLSPLHLA